MSDIVIKAESLGKKYTIGHQTENGRYVALRDVLMQNARSFWYKTKDLVQGRPIIKGDTQEEVWALKNVIFEIRRGEVVGIIGRNGAGKSTLLKVLSRITEPSAGRVTIKGRVASLLEVGTGFHPELTGRENIYLNGAILGMTRQEIKRRFDEIVAFAEVEKFLDTPVKRYSSGMYVRLAFAVAAHLEPEILLVDEVLAVGDAAFQKKCLGKIGDVAREGRTVLFVSHNMGAVRSLCGRAILLEQGQAIMDGDPSQVISSYLSSGVIKESEGQIIWLNEDEAPGGDELRLRGIRLVGPEGAVRSTFEVDKPIRVEIWYDVKRPSRGIRINLALLTLQGEIAFVTTDHNARKEEVQGGSYKSVCTILGGLLNTGKYIVKVGGGIPGVKVLLQGQRYLSFSTVGPANRGSDFPERWPGVVCPRLEWKIEHTGGLWVRGRK